MSEFPWTRFRLTFEEPQFTRWNDDWLVIGPAEALPLGENVMFRAYAGHMVWVKVREHVAEKVVHHRPDSYTGSMKTQTRYVVARVDR